MDSAILVIWAVFWAGWMAAAFWAKRTVRGRRRRARPFALLIIAVGAVVIRANRPHDAELHSVAVRGIGTAVVVCGLGLAVWARVMLGRNWGMPMTEKAEPELVTAGPYRLVRHPIYSGIVLATVGTALVVGLAWLVVGAVTTTYFVFSATVEERILTEQFPEAYPRYQAGTKMLIPFVL